MPYQVPLPKNLSKAGWKVRVFDNERGPEEPHFTILRKLEMWRVSLRSGQFLVPPGGRWRDIPEELVAIIQSESELTKMKAYWDESNPHNPVQSETKDDQQDG